MPTAVDGKGFSNIAATTASFPLKGGAYGVTVVATFSAGTVKLQRLALDGSTFVSMSASTDFSAAGGTIVNLPPGTYRFTIATATAVYAEVQGVPS